jgi:penicillin-binding protein 1C
VTNAAVLVIHNPSSEIRVWIGSNNFFNEQIDGQVDGVTSLRQPGSTLKPFTYGLALKNGYTAATILPDIETHIKQNNGDFYISNYDKSFHGPVRLRTALACSYNIPAVRILEDIGPDLLLKKLHSAGIKSLSHSSDHYGLGLTLGNGEVTLLELTHAYTALARQGRHRPLHFIQNHTNDIEQESIFTPSVCFILTNILSDSYARSPAFGLSSPLRLPFPCAAKTGTSKDFRDNWTVGYTTEYTVGVWVGNFDGTPMQHSSGITGAAPLFHDIMLFLHQNSEPAPFTAPKNLSRITICSKSGMKPHKNCPHTMLEWFINGNEPQRTCNVHQTFTIDTRTNRPATPETPEQFKRSKTFQVWPKIYHSWLQQNNIPIYQNVTSAQPKIHPEKRIYISFPDDGDMFKFDPILKSDYQKLLLSAVVPTGIDSIEWYLDDKFLATVTHPFSLYWALEQGDHCLEIRVPENTQADKIHIKVF